MVMTSTLPVAVTKMSPRVARFFHGDDLIAFHRRLQRADRVDFGDQHAAAGIAQAGGRAFADIAEAGDHGDLAGHHHVGATADAVHQAFAAAIQIVELRLGDEIVHVDRGHQQRAGLRHVPEPVHAGRGFFGNAANVLQHLGIFVVHQLGDVAAVIEDHVRGPAVRTAQGLLDAPPEFFLRHALPGEHRHAGRGDRGGGLVLRRENIAGGPAHRSAERGQRLDQHRGLDRHVQAADDARAVQRLALAELGAQRHQARHLVLGHLDLLAAPCGQRDVLDPKILAHTQFLYGKCCRSIFVCPVPANCQAPGGADVAP